jgi:hypothetical protein
MIFGRILTESFWSYKILEMIWNQILVLKAQNPLHEPKARPLKKVKDVQVNSIKF